MSEQITPSLIVTFVVAFTLLAGLGVRLWLISRQIRHVSLNRFQVPVVFETTISLSSHQKAADYTLIKTRFSVLEMAFGATVIICWTFLGGLNALNLALTGWLGGGMVQQLALVTSFVIVGGLLEFPLGLYQTFGIEQRFGFNKMTIKLWLSDLVKSTLVAACLGLPVLALLLWIMEATGEFWWLWSWSFWMGFNLLLLIVYPTFIAPIFNQFKPLEDAALRDRVNKLMSRCGFSSKGLFVMDGSKRSAHANAYFTGFGAAKRVVFYDTLLKQLTPGEVDAVLAHELGHFKHKHIIKRILSMFGMSLLAFALLGWLAAQAWFYSGLGVTPNLGMPNNALALLLFMLTAPVFSFFITPLMALISRKHEFEADAYAVNQTSGSDLSSALLKLYEDNASTLTPDPLFAKFYYSHPPASERLVRILS